MYKWLWGLIIAIGLSGLSWAITGSAHSDLEKTYPKANEVLTERPETVEFWFRDPVVIHSDSVRLTDSAGKPVPLGALTNDPENKGRIISEILKPLEPGVYTALVNVIALDGYVIEEEVRFTIADPVGEIAVFEAAQEVELLDYSPADGETTESSPQQLDFWFNQPVELTAVGVFDRLQQTVSTANPVVDPADPNHITVELNESLTPGTYQVTWYARPSNPEAFTYETLDVFYFAVDRFTPIEEGGNNLPKEMKWFPSAGIKQAGYWLWFTGISALFGLLFFKSVILPEYVSPRWRTVSIVLFGLTAAGISVMLLVLWKEVGGLPLRQFVALKFVWVPLLQLSLLLAGLFLQRAGAALAGAAVLLTPFVTGHAAYPKYGGYWSIAASGLHLGAVAIWIGGLIAVITVSNKQEVKELLLEALPRYAKWALFSLFLLSLTGIYMTITYVPSFSLESFIESEWGKAIIVKLVFTFFIVVIGFLQRRTIQRLTGQSIKLVVNRAKAEVIYGMLILLAASLLVVSTPKAAEQGIYPSVVQQDDMEARLEITPLKLGLNVFTLSFEGAEVQKAEVTVSMPPNYNVSYETFHTGPNEFKLTGNILHAAGTADVMIKAIKENGKEEIFLFRVVVPGEMRYNE